jgi:hypothetical protein
MAEKKQKSRNVTIKLKYSIAWGEQEINEIVLRPPTGSDIEHLGDKPTMKDLLMIASKCSLQPPAVFKKMDAIDTIKVSEAVADFLDDTPKTGKAVW